MTYSVILYSKDADASRYKQLLLFHIRVCNDRIQPYPVYSLDVAAVDKFVYTTSWRSGVILVGFFTMPTFKGNVVVLIFIQQHTSN